MIVQLQIKLKMRSFLLGLITISVLCLIACSGYTKKSVVGESDQKRAGLNLSNADSYVVHLKYRNLHQSHIHIYRPEAPS